MREIKFRYIFENDDKEICSVEIITLKELEIGKYNWIHLPTQTLKVKARNLFTGLLDKNGKEIYESDKVRFNTIRDDLTEGIVKWSDSGAYWMIDSKLPLLLHRAGNLEVIGNVYETPMG